MNYVKKIKLWKLTIFLLKEPLRRSLFIVPFSSLQANFITIIYNNITLQSSIKIWGRLCTARKAKLQNYYSNSLNDTWHDITDLIFLFTTHITWWYLCKCQTVYGCLLKKQWRLQMALYLVPSLYPENNQTDRVKCKGRDISQIILNVSWPL
jgi:hypothetical protein